jgi:hypothetical protein
MPSADFRRPVGRPCGRPSPATQTSVGTGGGSPEVSSTVFDARPPDLRVASLMDMGFAINCPLARRSRLGSGSCTSARVFASPFLQTSPRGDALGVGYPSPPSGWTGTCTRNRRTCSAHKKKEPPLGKGDSRPGRTLLLSGGDLWPPVFHFSGPPLGSFFCSVLRSSSQRPRLRNVRAIWKMRFSSGRAGL